METTLTHRAGGLPVSPSSSAHQRRLEWLANLPTVAMLLLILVISTGEMIHGQLLKFGEQLFHDTPNHVQYFMLRVDPVKPACDPRVDIDAEIARQNAARAARTDDIDSLFSATVNDLAAQRQSLAGTLAVCQAKHDSYQQVIKHITPAVAVYRAIETRFFMLFHFGSDNRSMILLLLMAFTAIPTSLGFHHVVLRPPHYLRDFQMQSMSMALGCSLIAFSCLRYYQIASNSGIAVDDSDLHFTWIAMFTGMAAASLYTLWRLPERAFEQGTGTWLRSLECVPLVAAMAQGSCLYFFMAGHEAGPAIYMNKLLDIVSLPLALALHIWAGMLFKQSRLVEMFMNILRPWKLSPEALTYVILLAAGLPTAYAGVSTVFVIAAGAIIYHEVRLAGGSAQYSLAVTAMSGSLGVVLRPSLLVVGIAALNKEVTTAQLFHWGGYVFALTSTLFFIASQLHRRQRHQRSAMAPVSEALPAMLRQLWPVVPYVLLIGVVLFFYEVVLDTPFNELSAPHILPIMMLALLVFDKRQEAKSRRLRGSVAAAPVLAIHGQVREATAGAAIRVATTDTVGHVGAYIMLMVLSQVTGGMIERSEIMGLAPTHFANVWVAMAFLVVVKVAVGMFMEPIGAIILVSSTLAPIAYNNGIDPLHFWMMVLVAFELGYLFPPVALNQLITRQVVGEAEIDRADAEVAHLPWYARYERWLLPLSVMSFALCLIAFGPLAVQRVEWLKPVAGWFN
ncbi:MAG: TRAP transporter large permease subunit [Rubrivivax sp.]|nr:MAG: TRAP transporter large permease subunit [Rubrivivax sp.]